MYTTELCLQLTAGSRPVNGDEHRALGSESCDRALLTGADFMLFSHDCASLRVGSYGVCL